MDRDEIQPSLTESKGTFIRKEVDSDLLIYNPDIDEVHILNDTAKAIYKFLCEGKTVREIEEKLQKQFIFEEGHDLYRDIEGCISLLREKGLISEDRTNL
jgi:hypothetical protein